MRINSFAGYFIFPGNPSLIEDMLRVGFKLGCGFAAPFVITFNPFYSLLGAALVLSYDLVKVHQNPTDFLSPFELNHENFSDNLIAFEDKLLEYPLEGSIRRHALYTLYTLEMEFEEEINNEERSDFQFRLLALRDLITKVRPSL